MPLDETLIEYLSKEIETATTTTVAFRAKGHFTVYIGPFALLGALFFSAKSIVRPKDAFDWVVLIACLATLLASYSVMGYVSYCIERGSRQQCDRWRGLILKVATASSAPLTDADLPELKVIRDGQKIERWWRSPRLWKAGVTRQSLGSGYLAAWAAMFVVFISVLVTILLLMPPK
jgi:amino acid transporter